MEETGSTGEGSGEEVQGRKPPPAPLLPRQQKKLTTVNTMAGLWGWCTHMGATPGHRQRFPEQGGGLEEPAEKRKSSRGECLCRDAMPHSMSGLRTHRWSWVPPPEYLLVTPGLLSPSTNQGTRHASPGGHGAHTESPVCSRVRPCTRRLNNPEQLLRFLRSERDRPPAAFTVVRSGHV